MFAPQSSASVGSVASEGSDDSHGMHANRDLEKHERVLLPPVLIYHSSARSIVFRDHLRRAATDSNVGTRPSDNEVYSRITEKGGGGNGYDDFPKHANIEIEHDEPSHMVGIDTMQRSSSSISGFQPNIVPLPSLQLCQGDQYLPLLESDKDRSAALWNDAEKEVVELLEKQMAVVKTLKNDDWTSFLHRFKEPKIKSHSQPDDHSDIPPQDSKLFNSFVTSTSLLPPEGKKMRCYGNSSVYTTGVVFALPKFSTEKEETEAVESTRTWSWPSGYSAKTEFNIDSRGNLINGRQEALVSLSTLRKYNLDYVNKSDYIVGGRIIKGGLKTVPYNEVFVRVGGYGRFVKGKENPTETASEVDEGAKRSLKSGVGLPIALFVRTAKYGHLISLLRTRARLLHVWGEKHMQGIPLLLITPDLGVRVLTESLQIDLLKIASKNLNPFQNPMIAYKTTIDNTDETHLEVKLEELIDLDAGIRQTLTPEECVRLAGGFGATDESIAQILKDAMLQDKENKRKKCSAHKLQDIVNEGLASAVRSGDFFTSRQLLILYSLVAAEGRKIDLNEKVDMMTDDDGNSDKLLIRQQRLDSEAQLLQRQASQQKVTIQNSHFPPLPPPPPLDTDRLRSATNSDGLLAVLGAAQVLKAMQDGSAKRRTEESFLAVEEWVEHGEQSMTFRLASWRDQRAAQDDLQIAFDNNSSLFAFVSNKAITNRKKFAKNLRDAIKQTDFSDVNFLRAIYSIVQQMHSPCLRLELLQYVLGLDNRYSIAHVRRSIELAATCMSISC